MTVHLCKNHALESGEGMYQHALSVCKEKKLRLTTLRKRILKLIIHTSEPLNAYTLVASLKESGLLITATTVYRTLDFLEQHGLIHRLASRNAYISCITPGHSFQGQFWICQQCHTVMEMHDPSVNQAIESCAVNQKFVIERQVVEVWGRCADCNVSGVTSE